MKILAVSSKLVLLTLIFSFCFVLESMAQARIKRDCYYLGEKFEHGSIRKDSRGNTYKCDDGFWVSVKVEGDS